MSMWPDSIEFGEFFGRFKHTLPNGFKRIRHYGLVNSAHKVANLAAARTALEAPIPHPATVETGEAFMRWVTQLSWLIGGGRGGALSYRLNAAPMCQPRQKLWISLSNTAKLGSCLLAPKISVCHYYWLTPASATLQYL